MFLFISVLCFSGVHRSTIMSQRAAYPSTVFTYPDEPLDLRVGHVPARPHEQPALTVVQATGGPSRQSNTQVSPLNLSTVCKTSQHTSLANEPAMPSNIIWG